MPVECTCPECGTRFARRPTRAGPLSCCSVACGKRLQGRRKAAWYAARFEATFWDRFERPGPDACWPFRGARDRHGYGKLGRSGKIASSHRLAYTLAHGTIPEGLFVCHRCDNPPCGNPAHLFVATAKENQADRVRKGR